MALNKVQDWHEAAASNTDIGSISIAEGMAPSNVNNAKREGMSQIRKWNLYRGHISGIVPAIDSDTDHDINFPIGEAADSTNVQMIHVDTALVKRIDANWAAGTGNGGFPSGLTLSADTWYHLFVIVQTDGTVDAGFDTSLTAANLLTDASTYTLYRRVGSVRTDGSSNITAFTAREVRGGSVRFNWDSEVTDSSSTASASDPTNLTLTVPTGVVVRPRLRGVRITLGTDASFAVGDGGASSANIVVALPTQAGENEMWLSDGALITDTSARIVITDDGNSSTNTVITLGWYDDR